MRAAILAASTITLVAYSALSVPAAARVWNVPSEAPTIQAGIDSATTGDVVELADGVYQRSGNRDLDFCGKRITVRSQTDDPGVCIIDCQGSYADPHRGFMFHSGEDSNSILRGITIMNGSTQEPCPGCSGGAIFCENESSPTIINCVFLENVASTSGGAIKCMEGCSPKILDCSFIDNLAVSSTNAGGGLACSEGFAGPLERCIFIGNSAGNGGAASFWESSPEIVDCSFIDNYAAVHGGGVETNFSQVSFSGCTFAGNSAVFGGGVMIFGGVSVSVIGCTFSGNSAPFGAGLHVFDSAVEIENSIIAFNANGEALSCEGSAEAALVCSDLYGNEGGDWIGCIGDQANVNGNLSVDPLFCDIDSGDFTLFNSSPCLPENNDCGILIGSSGPGCSGPSAVPLAEDVQLATVRCSPNPFNPQTTITFTLNRQQWAKVLVYDLAGIMIAVLADREYDVGDHSVVWNGKDATGRAVPSGTYIVRLETESGVEASKMMLVR